MTIPKKDIVIVTHCNGVVETHLFTKSSVEEAIEEIEELSDEYNARQFVVAIFESRTVITRRDPDQVRVDMHFKRRNS